MVKQKSAAAAGAVATGPVPRPPVLEHTTSELVSLIANLSEREDFTVDILGQAFALAQQRVGISVPGATPTELPSTSTGGHPSKPRQPASTQQIWEALVETIVSKRAANGSLSARWLQPVTGGASRRRAYPGVRQCGIRGRAAGSQPSIT